MVQKELHITVDENQHRHGILDEADYQGAGFLD